MTRQAPRKPKQVKQVFPRGWNQKRVQEVIDCYDKQTEDEEVAEYEAAMKLQDLTMMFVPRDRLIARGRGARKVRRQGRGTTRCRPGCLAGLLSATEGERGQPVILPEKGGKTAPRPTVTVIPADLGNMLRPTTQ
jgi:hypothetical protein